MRRPPPVIYIGKGWALRIVISFAIQRWDERYPTSIQVAGTEAINSMPISTIS